MSEQEEILIVEDTSIVLNLLTDILSAEGFQVRSANNGELALDSIAAKPPHLILLDIKMSGMDGFEVCRRLKSQEKTRDIPIIFVSVITDFEQKVKGFELGAVDFISKPFQREELLARVRTHLELNRLRTKLEAQVAERTAQLRIYQTLFEHTGTALIILEEDTTISLANNEFATLTGYTKAEIEGNKKSTDFTAPQDKDEIIG